MSHLVCRGWSDFKCRHDHQQLMMGGIWCVQTNIQQPSCVICMMSSLLARISLQVGWIGAFQVGLDIRLDWISCDHLQRVKCGDCIKFEAIFQFFDMGYRRFSGNWSMMLFHLKGGCISDLEFQRNVAIWHQQLCFSCFSWTIVNL